MHSKLSTCLLALAAGVLLTTGCQSAKGESPAEKRDYVRGVRDQTLEDLYREDPTAKALVEASAGYACFSNVGSKIFLLATGNGFGIAVDNETGAETFMKMAEVGGGVGIGIKKFRAVFAFKTDHAFRGFQADGWDFGGDADATITHDEEGGGAGGQLSAVPDVTIYQLTDTGLALSATLAGTKYWTDKELSGPN